jgi:hypothetical protein
MKESRDLPEFVKKNRILSIEERVGLISRKIEIPVNIRKTESIISIGEYDIGNSHFLAFLSYLFRGGFIGWAEETPPFVKSALSAVKKSENPLYLSFK